MAQDPTFASEHYGDELQIALSGHWTAEWSREVEEEAQRLMDQGDDARRVVFDLSGIERIDTLGAWVLDRTRHDLGAKGISADFRGARAEQRILLDEVAYRGFQELPKKAPPTLIDFFEDVGKAVVGAGQDLASGTSFLGEIVAALLRLLINPRKFRPASLVHHIEQIAFRGLPIVALISFLVGCIVAQQGIFQLQQFGATAFVVNLVGILVLRELGLLLTSIMVAGRSGSAFTAEIGSMKMREEIDALRVMGLDPIEVLVVPRILALIISLPILTFLSSMSALLGAAITSFLYGGMSFEVFLLRLQSVIGMNTFLVGLIKAPFMALVIGVIACIEGLAVQGSAESLGRQVTASVVKSIFMVIVVDGLFAMFFASIRY